MLDQTALNNALATSELRVHARKRMGDLQLEPGRDNSLQKRFVKYAAGVALAGAVAGVAATQLDTIQNAFNGAVAATSAVVFQVPAPGTPQHTLMAGAGAAGQAAAMLDTKQPGGRLAYQQLKAAETSVKDRLAENTLKDLPLAPSGVLLVKVGKVLESVNASLDKDGARMAAEHASRCRADATRCQAPLEQAHAAALR